MNLFVQLWTPRAGEPSIVAGSEAGSEAVDAARVMAENQFQMRPAPRNWFVSFFQLDFCWVAIGQAAEAKPFSKEMGAFDQGGWVVHTVLCLVLWIQIGILVTMEKPFYFGG